MRRFSFGVRDESDADESSDDTIMSQLFGCTSEKLR